MWCARVRVDPRHANAVMARAGLEPRAGFPGAHRPWECRCMSCGTTVFPRFAFIQQGQRGCSDCGAKRGAVARQKESAVAFSDMRAALLEPVEPYPGKNKRPWLCRCLRCGKEVSPNYNSIQRGQGGCKWCARKVLDPREAADELRRIGLIPTEPFPGSNAPWRSACVHCQKISTPRYNDVISGRIVGCVWCNKRRVSPDDAVRVMLAANLLPLTPYVNNATPWASLCMKCNRTVYPRYGNMRTSQSGCRWCSPRGANFALPGLVYLVTHEGLNAHKIGISNIGTDRVENHRRQGWMVHAERRFEVTYDAYRVEQAVLRWWREDLALPVHLTADEVPQKGHTETVSADALSLPDVWAKVLELAAAQVATPVENVPEFVAPEQLVLWAA